MEIYKFKKKNDTYIALQKASEISSYTSDYIGRLARKKKIRAKKVYTQYSWVVNRNDIIPGNDFELIPKNVEQKDKKSVPEFLTLKEASEISGYNFDHLGRLAREGKIRAKQIFVSPVWQVHKKDLLRYSSTKKVKLSTKLSYIFVIPYNKDIENEVEFQKRITTENNLQRPLGLIPHSVIHISKKAKAFHSLILISKYATASVLILGIFLFGGIFKSIAVQFNTKNIEIFPTTYEVTTSEDSSSWVNPETILTRDLDPDTLIIDFNQTNSTSTVDIPADEHPLTQGLYDQDNHELVTPGIWAGLEYIFKSETKARSNEPTSLLYRIENLFGLRGAKAQEDEEQTSTNDSEQQETTTDGGDPQEAVIDTIEDEDLLDPTDLQVDPVSNSEVQADETSNDTETETELPSIESETQVPSGSEDREQADNIEPELPNIDGESAESAEDENSLELSNGNQDTQQPSDEETIEYEVEHENEAQSSETIYPYSKSITVSGFSSAPLLEEIKLKQESSIGIIDTDTTFSIADMFLKMSFASLPAPQRDGSILIEWSTNSATSSQSAQTWQEITQITQNTYYSNDLNNGYFSFPMDSLFGDLQGKVTPNDIDNLNIKVTALSNTPEFTPAYIDAIWLDVEYVTQNINDKRPKVKLKKGFNIQTDKTNYNIDEIPEITLINPAFTLKDLKQLEEAGEVEIIKDKERRLNDKNIVIDEERRLNDKNIVIDELINGISEQTTNNIAEPSAELEPEGYESPFENSAWLEPKGYVSPFDKLNKEETNNIKTADNNNGRLEERENNQDVGKYSGSFFSNDEEGDEETSPAQSLVNSIGSLFSSDDEQLNKPQELITETIRIPLNQIKTNLEPSGEESQEDTIGTGEEILLHFKSEDEGQADEGPTIQNQIGELIAPAINEAKETETNPEPSSEPSLEPDPQTQDNPIGELKKVNSEQPAGSSQDIDSDKTSFIQKAFNFLAPSTAQAQREAKAQNTISSNESVIERVPFAVVAVSSMS